MLVPSSEADFAVVSDIDDTIVRTKSTDFFRQIAIVFGNDARSRVAVRGMPSFYRALARGPRDGGLNPIFYVSMSGWNLYDLMEEFMDVNEIPAGPLFLSDLRVVEDPSSVMGSRHHKFENIDILLRAYPELPFLLVGDSGMHDPELYAKIAKEHPGRIKAIYIHDVSPPHRDGEVDEIAQSLDEQGVLMVRVRCALEAAQRAMEHGFITHAGLEEVQREAADEPPEEEPEQQADRR